MLNKIVIRGARTHNLKNIDLEIPKYNLVVITGLSGSGKSSLAFDTLYAEGQRRYVESLSAYARQFLQRFDKPDVDLIEGLSPAISIEQKTTYYNPRSTVGTITEIYDYLRLLFARIGKAHCPEHNLALESLTITTIINRILELPENTRITILSPIIVGRKGEYLELFKNLYKDGFSKVRINNTIYEIHEVPSLNKNQKHNIDLIIDRIKITPSIKERLIDSLNLAVQHSASGKISIINLENDKELSFSTKYTCPKCDYSISELEPRIFSFNSPYGACNKCNGLGKIIFFDPNKVIVNNTISVADGAIKGWDKQNMFSYQVLICVAKHYHFSLDTSWNELSKEAQNILLYGSNHELINMKIVSNNRVINQKQSFEGIINTIERRYLETESQHIKEELSQYQNHKICFECEGSRLNKVANNIYINNTKITEIIFWQLYKCYDFFKTINLTDNQKSIAHKIINEIVSRIEFLINIGLEYITLQRSTDTLSGGEIQRIRLASQICSGLTGVMYILDEPSIGLHQRDNAKLLSTLKNLRDLGNTVIVVEHDEEIIRTADYIIDIGPMAGRGGGNVVAAGNLSDIINSKESITGQFLNNTQSIDTPKKRRKQNSGYIDIIGAKGNNLKGIDVKIPLGNFVCITGVSGSGKSTLVNDTLYKVIANKINHSDLDPCEFKEINGLDNIDKIINIDQSPIGRTPRSNPATYTGLFTDIRELFAMTNLARERGYSIGRFSFNVKGGRCEACAGDGLIKVEMYFLPDIYVLCDVCHGKRYNNETLDVKYNNKNISDVLNMTVEEAHSFFKKIPTLNRKLQTLIDVGLGYIHLNQAATTLSGGEAQRVKLSLELSKRSTTHTLYILDEPTTGLHFYDIKLLLNILHKLVAQGNSVVVIEHNLHVIKTADWIIDLGPEGGNGGGEIVVAGTPEKVAKCKTSYTGKFLRDYL